MSQVDMAAGGGAIEIDQLYLPFLLEKWEP
jgi:hypothetical protein